MREVGFLLVVALGLGLPPLLQTSSDPLPFNLEDIGEQAGLRGVTVCGNRERLVIAESAGSGLCWLDFNNDGFQDLFVANGSTLEHVTKTGFEPDLQFPNYLYRNNGDGTFQETAQASGIALNRWSTGCAAADYDNDGWTDLFVSGLGECFLYRNNGDGTFTDRARAAGVTAGFDWHTGAAFGDYDGDGFLDLYVAGYVDIQEVLKPRGTCDWKGQPAACGPEGLKGAPDRLFKNDGRGAFRDVTVEAGVQDRELAYGFTASFEDFDNDGRLDILVANDMSRNYLYHNRGGSFEEVGELWGIGYPAAGKAQANMGIALGDYNRDGLIDAFITTFSDDQYTLFRNEGEIFADVSAEAGLARVTYPFLGWGTFFADFDNDGWLELFMANGHIFPVVDRLPDALEKFLQRPLLFRRQNPGSFQEVGSRLSVLKPSPARGAAYADFDNDGDVDLAFTRLDDRPVLLRNSGSSANYWLSIRTRGVKSNRDGIGARLRIRSGDLMQIATVRSGESYLSGNDIRVHFGLGQNRRIDELEIRWPSGLVERHERIDSNQFLVLEEGLGSDLNNSIKNN